MKSYTQGVRRTAVVLEIRSRGVVLALLAVLLAGCGRQAEPETPAVPVHRRPRAPRAETLAPKPDPQSAEPAEALAVAAPEAPVSIPSDSGTELGRGLLYRNDRVRTGPWSINLVKVDRSRTDLELTTTLGSRGRTLGLSPLSEQIESLPPELGLPLAAVNGDYYRTEHEPYAGDPRGLQIMGGELVSSPMNREVSFWIDASGKPMMSTVVAQFKATWPGGETTPLGLNEERHSIDAILYTHRIGSYTRTSGGRELILVRHGENPWLPLRIGCTYKAEVRQVREGGNSPVTPDVLVLSIGPALLSRVPRVKAGAVLEISTATSPELTGAQVALGGGPVIVHEGKVTSAYTNKAHERHPRTAFGWSDKYFYFAEVDGRQYGFSVGMTLPELGAYLVKQGCQEAMNLDGGGSAEMWVEGQIVNRPCFGYERSTANSLVVVRKDKVLAR